MDVIHTDGESALKLGLGMMQPVSLYSMYIGCFHMTPNQVRWRYNELVAIPVAVQPENE